MLSKFIAGANKSNSIRAFSTWGHLTAAPIDPILGVNEAFKADKREGKTLLGVGAYRDNDGKPLILECVKEAERRIMAKNMDHEYAPIQGIDSYIQKSQVLAFGDAKVRTEGRLAGVQSLSGTGALRVGFQFFSDWYPHKDIDILIPNPTWPVHRNIPPLVGLPKHTDYRYFHKETKGLDFDGMCDDLMNAKDHSFVMLHVCAHNPTGVDPTQAQWEKILEICLKKKFFCGFDSAYQGFASGDLEKDAFSLRLFSEHTNDIMLFQSFAKNFGLYGERAGCMHVVTNSKEETGIVNGRLKQIARPIYSNPPVHGARIVDEILSDDKLTADWHQDLRDMSGRIQEMRFSLVNKIKALGNEHNWEHVTNQIGMFAYTGLNQDAVVECREKHAIYMTADGRISIAGLNTGNIDNVAKAFHSVTHGKSF